MPYADEQSEGKEGMILIMKNKKFFMYLGIILIVIIIIGVGYIVINNIKNKDENSIEGYIPEAEITEEQLRQTLITLYFLDSENYKLVPEARQIDAKELLKDPYKTLINLLIEGPKNEKLIKLIPDKADLNSAEIRDNILYLDFSKEFINEQNLGKEQEELIIKSIVNTVTELTEVNQVAFLIDGKSGIGFPDGGVNFNKVFVREK